MCVFFVNLREDYRETDAVIETIGSLLVTVGRRWFPELKRAESMFICPSSDSHRYFVVLVPTA